MKRLTLLLVLLTSCWAFGQGGTTSSDILPANTGQNLGSPTQQWNLFSQDTEIYRNFKLANPSGLKWMNIQPQFTTNLVTCTRENGQKCYFDVAPGGTVTPHHLLGSQHDDTVAFSPPNAGDLIIGGIPISGLWQRLPGNVTASPLCLVEQGNGSNTTSVSWQACSSATNTVAVQHNGSLIGTQPTENFIDSAGFAWNITQDTINHKINITQSLTGGTGCTTAGIAGQVLYDSGSGCGENNTFVGGTPTSNIWRIQKGGEFYFQNSDGALPGNNFYSLSDSGAGWMNLAQTTYGQLAYWKAFNDNATPGTSTIGLKMDVFSDLSNTTNFGLLINGASGAALTNVGMDGVEVQMSSSNGFTHDTAFHGVLENKTSQFSSTFWGEGALSDGQSATSAHAWNYGLTISSGKSYFQDIILQPEVTVDPAGLTVAAMMEVPCVVAQRGRIHYVNSGTGVADLPEVCAKTSADAYTWTPIIGAGASTTWIPRGVWDASTAYAINNVVTFNGSSYLSPVANSGVAPGSDGGVTWFLIAQAGMNGVNGSNGTNGTNGAPGAPGYSPNQIVSGCGVSYSGTGFTFTVAACTYLINQVQYSAPQTTLTGGGANVSLDRVDSIVANSCSPLPCVGTITIIPGTASATPAPPSIDITTQTQLTFYQVAASATTPTNLVITDIYHENAEWTCNGTTHVNCASTSNPRSGTKDIEWTSSVSGNNATLTIPSGTIDISTRNVLNLYLRFKAPLSNATLVAQWFNGTTAKCTPVTLKDGNFGINSSNTSTYQLASIPVSVFNCGGIPVTRLQILQAGTGTLTGFYIDDVTLQGGLTPPTSNPGLQWCGVWNSTTAFAVNCEVTQNSLTYTALQASTSLSPSANPTIWAVHSFGVPGVTGNLVYNAATGTNTLAALNTAISGADVTFPGTVSASTFISTDTVDNTFIDFITGSGGDSTCPAPLAAHNYFCNKSSVVNISLNGGAYAPIGTGSGSPGSPAGSLQYESGGVFAGLTGSSITSGQLTLPKTRISESNTTYTDPTQYSQFYVTNTATTGAETQTQVGICGYNGTGVGCDAWVGKAASTYTFAPLANSAFLENLIGDVSLLADDPTNSHIRFFAGGYTTLASERMRINPDGVILMGTAGITPVAAATLNTQALAINSPSQFFLSNDGFKVLAANFNDTAGLWQLFTTFESGGLEVPLVLGTLTNRANQLTLPVAGGICVGCTASVTGVANVATGYRINGAAASGHYLRGNGTNYVDSTIPAADLPAGVIPPTPRPYTYVPDSASVSSVSQTIAVTTGDLVVVSCRFATGSTCVTTSTGTGTPSSWTAIAAVGSGANQQQVSWGCATGTGTLTVTGTQSGSAAGMSLIIIPYANTTCTADVSTTYTSGAGAISESGALTTTQRDLVVSCTIADHLERFTYGQLAGTAGTLRAQSQSSITASNADQACMDTIVTVATPGISSQLGGTCTSACASTVVTFKY